MEALVRGQRGLHINLLALAGAMIGFASFFTIWLYIPPSMPSPRTPWMFPDLMFMLDSGPCFYQALLFATGTALVLVTPLAGGVQLAGLMSFVLTMLASYDDPVLDGISPVIQPRLGLLIGCVSTVIVLVSLWRPVSYRRPHSGGNGVVRFLVQHLTIRLD